MGGDASLTITNSNVSSNTGSSSGASGAGILAQNQCVVVMTNTTVYNNSSSGSNFTGGGIGASTIGGFTITNCTIVNNTAQYGGGIELSPATGVSNNLIIKNTIVANNTANAGDGSDDLDLFQGSFVDNGYNIFEQSHITSAFGSISGNTITGNQTNLFGTGISATPSPAINNSVNGTMTIKTISGSVAINAGNNSTNGSVSIPATDQRGAGRNGAPDIGAYEYWTDAGSLPVELNSFTASNVDNTINLKWQTATEVNNYGFEVQKMSENSGSSPCSVEAWEKIGFIKGNGTSNNVNKYSFVDKTASGTALKYRLKQIDNDGQFQYSKVVEVSLEQPVDYSLSQNFPNPFNPSTEISYSIPKSNNVELKVYNSIGKEVATLVNGMQEAGNHKVQFNSSNLSSGIYFYRLTSGNFTQIKKMILIK